MKVSLSRVLAGLSVIFMTFILSDCKKPERIIKIITLDVPASDISYKQINISGEIIDTGSGSISDHGILIKKSNQSDSDYQELSLGSANNEGVFTAVLSNPENNTEYTYRAFAKHENSVVSGEAKSFTTLAATAPSLSTIVATNITQTTAVPGGTITGTGGSEIADYGICWNKTGSPTLADSSRSDGTTGSDTYSTIIDNLEPATQYYYRSYATNSIGTGYGDVLSFSTLAEPATGTFTDTRDGKTYGWVQIGYQKWMSENLAYLPLVNPGSDGSDDYPKYYVFDHNSDILDNAMDAYNYLTYGTLYNWTAAMNGSVSNNDNPGAIQGVCPDGWYLPSDSEWMQLEIYLGMDQDTEVQLLNNRGNIGGKLKEEGTEYWHDDNTGATNITRFNGRPGGYNSSGQEFNSLGELGAWWTSTSETAGQNYSRHLHYNNTSIGRVLSNSDIGYSVRCVEGQGIHKCDIVTINVDDFSQTTAIVGGIIMDNGYDNSPETGIYWGTDPDPLSNGTQLIISNTGSGSFTTILNGLRAGVTYYYIAYGTNIAGTSYGSVESFLTPELITGTFTDTRDGTEYGWVEIGQKKWMSENLAYLPEVSPSNVGDAFNPLYYVYNYQGTNVSEAKASTNFIVYGALYNWVAAMDSALSNDENPGAIQGVCPDGWHLPSDSEWKTLEIELGMSADDANLSGQRGSIGGSLKQAGLEYWSSPNTGADNSSGFTALPAGQRKFDDVFGGISYEAHWWTSTQQDVFNSYSRVVDYAFTSVYRTYPNIQSGLSVRCVEGQGVKLPTVTTEPATNITSGSADLNLILHDDGNEQTDFGFYLGTDNDPATNGTNYSAGNGYSSASPVSTNVNGLLENTIYYAVAYATNTAGTSYGDVISFTTLVHIEPCPEQTTVDDYEGNTYTTVLVGGQCWLGNNLKSKYYSDGSSLSDGSGLADIAGDNTGKYYFFYNDDEASYGDSYGALYTWAAAMNGMTSADAGMNGIQGVCPTGWHLPDDDEWKTLETYLGMGAGDLDATGWRGTDQGGKLKETGTDYWSDPNNGATNESGFSARGAGYRGSISGYFGYFNQYADWWTATEYSSSEAYYRSVHNTETRIYRLQYPMHNGFSIRCVKNEYATVITDNITSISGTTATSGGNVVDAGRGTVTARGVCWNTGGNPTISDPHTTDGSGTGTFTSSLTNLSYNTVYYVKAYATTENGTVYGNEQDFSTPEAALPTLSTSANVNNITNESAEAGGELLDAGNGTITEMGLCWSTSTNPTESDFNETAVSNPFTLSLTGLSPGTTYYVRAYASNEAGTGYGEEISFVTDMVDADDNSYDIIRIGDQWWTDRNLSTTKYNDGTDIPLAEGDFEWTNLNGPGYCWYANNITYKNSYGALYTWYTINTGKICPDGWHVPTRSEWTTLINFAGGASVAGGKLKETGLTHWDNPNTGATDEYGFTGLPGGHRSVSGGNFSHLNSYGFWWCSDEADVNNTYDIWLIYDSSGTSQYSREKGTGNSVRCIKD